MIAQQPLCDAIAEIAESIPHLTTDEAKERAFAELNRCIQELYKLKNNQPPESE